MAQGVVHSQEQALKNGIIALVHSLFNAEQYHTMPIRTAFPHLVRVIKHTWITLADGSRLAARIWLPIDADQHPVPAILEYLPYRKNDGTAARDALRHPYFAGHGYASVRVDMRGSGDSDGILYDEYLPQEQDDALEVLAWIAAQPWCNGKVGMIGISWGGFNGLQIAARRPPELKAVISLCSTDDRYADDVHYMGGCLLAVDMLPWASTMLAFNARPPDPEVVGEAWRATWLDRMERTPPFSEAWLRHQRRDAYWRHGSVCEDYGAISCPVYAVGGWADGYTNAVFRLLEGLTCPRKGLIGPWAHAYPEVATPGPQIGFAQECVRWWDYWLKDIDTGIMDEPMLRVWLQDSVAPEPSYTFRPGRWVAEETWPAPAIDAQTFVLKGGTLADAAAEPSSTCDMHIASVQTHGLAAGAWCAYGLPDDYPPDQSAEDEMALCFTSAPLAAPMEILGFPELTLTLSADQPLALLVARLCDVAPDGTSALVSRGLLNLTHRESHAHPTPLEPGKLYSVTLRLNAAGYALPAGHRWRVAIAPAYWPHAWPSPVPVTLCVRSGAACRLVLPRRAPRAADAALPPFGPPEHAPPPAFETLRSAARKLTVQHEMIEGRSTLCDQQDGGRLRFAVDGLTYDTQQTDSAVISEGDPLSARYICERSIDISRGAWRTRVETLSTLHADATTFHLTNQLDAYEGETQVFTRTWQCSIPRDMV